CRRRRGARPLSAGAVVGNRHRCPPAGVPHVGPRRRRSYGGVPRRRPDWLGLSRGRRRARGARRAVDAAHRAGGLTVIALVGVWLAVVGGGARRWRPARARPVTPRQPPAAVRRLRLPVAVGVGCVVLLFVWPPLAIGVVGVVSMGPSLARRRAERRRTLAIRRQLPDVVDLLVVAISAGLTPALAIDCLAALAPDPFAGAFDEVRGRRRRGQPLAHRLGVLPQRLAET